MRCGGARGRREVRGGPKLLQADLMGALFGVDGFLKLAAAIFLGGEGMLLLLCSKSLFHFSDFEFLLAARILKLEL